MESTTKEILRGSVTVLCHLRACLDASGEVLSVFLLRSASTDGLVVCELNCLFRCHQHTVTRRTQALLTSQQLHSSVMDLGSDTLASIFLREKFSIWAEVRWSALVETILLLEVDGE